LAIIAAVPSSASADAISGKAGSCPTILAYFTVAACSAIASYLAPEPVPTWLANAGELVDSVDTVAVERAGGTVAIVHVDFTVVSAPAGSAVAVEVIDVINACTVAAILAGAIVN